MTRHVEYNPDQIIQFNYISFNLDQIKRSIGPWQWSRTRAAVSVETELTSVMAESSSVPPYLNMMRWRSISEKYSLASLLVLVPRPGTRVTRTFFTHRYMVEGRLRPRHTV